MVKQYRKKPVIIKAVEWTGSNLREVIDFIGPHPSAEKWTWEEYEQIVKSDGLKIFTLEGTHIATVGDFIIKGVQGEPYPCKPDIFAKTYELVNDMEKYENFYHDKYGYCYYSIEPGKKPVIFNLYVEPEYRQKGHARKFLQFIIDEIRKTGYQGEIEIEADPRENSIEMEKLISLYKSLGLEVIESTKNIEQQD